MESESGRVWRVLVLEGGRVDWKWRCVERGIRACRGESVRSGCEEQCVYEGKEESCGECGGEWKSRDSKNILCKLVEWCV